MMPFYDDRRPADEQMGSQTLEILRQGVWASLTGGWFYDPHQDVFCNTFHLYIWLFLLCLPFSIYVYFPPTQFIWYLYCGSVTVVLTTIKLVNYGLHHMYDTTESIQEIVEDDWHGSKRLDREDEGIELQILSKKTSNQSVEPGLSALASFAEASAQPSTDADSMESSEFHPLDVAEGGGKLCGTIGLKAEVHRKNSSESSDDVAGATVVEIVQHDSATERKLKRQERRAKQQRSKTDGFMCVTFSVKDERSGNSKKPYQHGGADPQGNGSPMGAEHGLSPRRADSTWVESSVDTVGPRRHSNFTNGSLGFLPSSVQSEIKPTGSLELAYIDKNLNRSLTSEEFYFKVRRIRSTALETCCPPPSLAAHPNSLEVIGCKGARNPLPPPSSSLRRNQHLNLCPYYGSEIVYPIAEQSDEHQTSQGQVSDSDFEENQGGSHSPLIYVKLERLKADGKAEGSNSGEFVSNSNPCSSNTSVECEEVARVKSEENAIVRKRNVRRNKKRKFGDKAKIEDDEGNFSSLVELDLDWLFEENSRLQNRKEPLKRDTEWSSATSVSLEHDVSKVLQETVPSLARSLGAIPKKSRIASPGQAEQRRTPKSESEKCSVCRCKPEDDRGNGAAGSSKENKVTQTLGHSDSPSPSPVEGSDCVYSPAKPSRGSLSKRGSLSRASTSCKAEEASSSGSNTELSTLLPPAPLLSAFLNSRRDVPSSSNIPIECLRLDGHSKPHRHRLKRTRVNRRRSGQLGVKKDQAVFTSLTAGYGTHGAKSFNDTSNGSVHCFMDEHGNWVTYTFDEKGVGTANAQLDGESGASPRRRQSDCCASAAAPKAGDAWDSNSADSVCAGSVSAALETGARKPRVHPAAPYANAHALHVARLRRALPDHLRRRILSDLNLNACALGHATASNASDNELEEARTRFRFARPVEPGHGVVASGSQPLSRTKTYYKLKLSPWSYVKVTLDRLKLLTLLDRNLTLAETVISAVLGAIVSALGATMLLLGFYEDFSAFVLCFVMAGCQYSLLKSVQPDAASPTHGFNRIIAYSRPVYFALFSLLVLVVHSYSGSASYDSLDFRELELSEKVLLVSRDFLAVFILFFPVLFSLGLFPQIDTFALYLLEQIDMHLFGGNAMSSLLGSFCCLFRSIVAVLALEGLAYASLCEGKGSQHVLFSIFCACLVPCSYHLSRSASDPSHIWDIVKKHLWLPDNYREQELKKERRLRRKNEKNRRIEMNNKRKDGSKERVRKSEDRNVNLRMSEERIRNDDKNAKIDEKCWSFENDDKSEGNDNKEVLSDPLPAKLRKTVNARLRNDVIVCSLVAVLVFGLHASTVFTVLQPELTPVLWSIAATVGFVLHYVVPQMRKQLPWLCVARPIFRSHEHDQYQIRGPAKIMWFERVYVYFCFFERNILYPLLFLSTLTENSPRIAEKFGIVTGSFVLVVCGLKCLRSSYSDQSSQYMILVFTALFFKYDCGIGTDLFIVEYFLMSIAYHKLSELVLKVQFVVTYIAPWQITWGSAFHAFAQPFSVPHSAMLFLQAIVSSILSTPLNPFLGSAIFLTSYVRPVKFWERDYNTRRVDHSNTPLSSHLDRNLGADDNNLNSIFYEHLTRSLQHSLCGDLKLGRWGPAAQGDCFVLASDNLNCLVHIVEMGNDLVTFQVRGLEFRGTYCQQREVEAINEGVEENDGCCCCNAGRLPNMLSANAAFSQRWLAWEVTAAKYVLEGYSISDNSAASMLQVFEFRKVLVSYYVKSIIFYAARSDKLESWLANEAIRSALRPMEAALFVDLDPVFNYNIDEDFDAQCSGMTRHMFMQVHGDWIAYCAEKNGKDLDAGFDSPLTLLCFGLSLLGRRALGTVTHGTTVSSAEYFLYGLHSLFKGDFRVTCARDEWVFTDMDLLKAVVAPGVRMSLKLHQDHFMSPDDYDELPALYEAICRHEEELVISHEGDPAWRGAVLNGTPSLLALRHVMDEGTDEYKIIMLNKRHLSFRVIKVNRECVRGLWAGQQQELVYLRNRNPERGSIQNAKQALRNIINSSCDQPIGYPIYVSPLTTSYAETNEQFRSLIGGSVSLGKIRDYLLDLFRRIRKRCGEGCSSGAGNREEIGMGHEGVYAMTPVSPLAHQTGSQSTDGSHLGGSIGRGSSLSRTSLGGNRGSMVSVGKPTSSTLASLAGLFKERDDRAVSQTPDAQARADERLGDINDAAEKEYSSRVRILDPNMVYDAINLGRRIDVAWPTEYMRIRGGRSHWKDWVPETGMEGPVVHKWVPLHKDPNKRSHVDRTILLVQIEDRFVPVAETGVQDLSTEA